MKLIETHLLTSDNQFGFKRQHGIDLWIFTVKSVIKYYNLCNSPVFTCFLDAFTLMIAWTIGHYLTSYWSDLFLLLLYEFSCFGTLSMKYVLDGELRCRLILILVMEYDKEECYLHLYLQYTWMIFLHCSRN